MELTQRMDCELFPRPSQRPAGSNKVGFLGIAGATYPVVLGVNKVGRDPTCHVSLDNQTVSRQHAVLNAQSAREVLLMDMGSANGTKLENAVLSAYVPCPIKNGDVVQFGDVFGVFRSLLEPVVDDFPATQRCALSPPPQGNRAPLRIPESPENSDLDDSIICLPKNTSATFRNSNPKVDLSKVKNESIQDCSLFEAETQQPEQPANDSRIFEAETQAPSNNDSHIFVAETQVDSPSELSRIFDADTQVPEGPVGTHIHTAETQAPVNDSKIFEAETQVEKPSDESRIFEAETQVDRLCDNSGIFSAETQVPTRDFHEANTQVPDRDIHMAETQVWLGRSSQVTSTPEDNTPEESSQRPELDEIDFAETQTWPENLPVTKLEETRPERKEDLAETQVWPELGPTEAPKEPSEINENRKEEEQFINNVAENIAEDPIVSPTLPSPTTLAENMIEGPIVSPTLPSPSKAKHPHTATSTKSESSDQEISFTEMEDDFMMCESQTVMEIDPPLMERDKDNTPNNDIEDLPTQIIPEKVNLPSNRANETKQNNTFEDMATQVIAEDVNEPNISITNEISVFEDMATQIIPGDINEPRKNKADQSKLDFEDMATQVIPGDIEPNKITAEKKQTFEVMATQVLPDDDDVLTQIIPTADPETSKDPEAFDEMLTQVIPEPEPKKDEIVFKIPHASPMKKRKSYNVTPVSSPRKIVVETNDENYYAATQDIMSDLNSQVIPLGYPLRRVGSGSSQGSDSQSQSFSGQNCIDDWDLPDSQEIAVTVASNVAPEQPVLSTSQSSDSEDEHPLPSILYKAPEKKKKVIENTENTDTARRSGRPRKPTVKARELDMMEIEEYTIVSRKPRSKKIKEEKKSPEIEKAKKKEPADIAGDKSRVEFPVNVKIKEEKKTPSETKRQSKKDAKSDAATPQNIEQSTLQSKERKPRCSRRIKQERESQSDKTKDVKEKSESTSTIDESKPTERTRRHRHKDSSQSVTVITEGENKKSDSDQKKPIERNRRHRHQDLTPTVIVIEEGDKSDSILKDENKPERTRRHKHKDKESPSVTLISDLETTDSLRRSRRLKPEEQSPLEISTAYDIDSKPGRKRSHGRDSQEISGVEKKTSCRKRARMEKMQGQHRVCLTSFPPAALPEIKKLLEGLGAVVVEDISSCTVLVSPSLRRTVKLLVCVGLGRPVVGRRWLEACAQSGALLDPWQHILRDEAAEQRFGCSLRAALRGARGFLRGRRLAATQSVKPPPDDLRKIIESSGGTWCEGTSIEWGTLCVTSEDDRGQWARLRRKGAELVHVDFILTGVLRQKADVEHFRLK